MPTLRSELAPEHRDGICAGGEPFSAQIEFVQSILVVPVEFISFFLVPERRENSITGCGVEGRKREARRLIPDGRPRVGDARAAREQSE